MTLEAAEAAGATTGEIVGTLVAVMPAIGSARVVSAAPKVALRSATTSRTRLKIGTSRARKAAIELLGLTYRDADRTTR